MSKPLHWMKTAILIFVSATLLGHAQYVISKNNPSLPNGLNDSVFTRQAAPPVILDPIRVINGETQKVDKTWLAVSGKVVQVHLKEGLRISGSIEGAVQPTDFLVAHLPMTVAEGDWLPPQGYVLLVKDAGTYTYNTAAGSTRTIHKYDYGIAWTPPPLTAEQRAALKAEADAHKAVADARVLESDEAAAARDEADGLERMAERYRDGHGVETNRIKARIYFMRAQSGGSTTAEKKMAQLENETPAATEASPAADASK